MELPPELELSLRDIDIPAILMSSSDARIFRERFSTSNSQFTATYFGESRTELGGRRYSDSERDYYYEKCMELLDGP